MTDFCHKYEPPVCENHAVCAYPGLQELVVKLSFINFLLIKN